mgnify:CR=1 FL=1
MSVPLTTELVAYDATVATNVLSAATSIIGDFALVGFDTVSVAAFVAVHEAFDIVTVTDATPPTMLISPASGSIVASPVESSSEIASLILPLYQL